MDYERLFTNLFYVFGSWLLVQGSYFFTRVNVTQTSFRSRWERWNYGIKLFFVAFGAIGFIALVSGLWIFYQNRFFTPEGMIQVAVVMGVPIIVGILKGLKTSTVRVPPSSQ